MRESDLPFHYRWKDDDCDSCKSMATFVMYYQSSAHHPITSICMKCGVKTRDGDFDPRDNQDKRMNIVQAKTYWPIACQCRIIPQGDSATIQYCKHEVERGYGKAPVAERS